MWDLELVLQLVSVLSRIAVTISRAMAVEKLLVRGVIVFIVFAQFLV